MKFTQEQVLEKIKALLGKTQKISDRTITDTISSMMELLGDESEIELDAFVEKAMKGVKSANTNFNDHEGKLIKKYKAKPVSKNDDDDDDDDSDDDEPEWAKKMRKSFEAKEKLMDEKLASFAESKRHDELRSGALAKFKETNKDVLGKLPEKISTMVFKRIGKALETVDKDSTVDTLVTKATEEFKELKEFMGNEYTPSDGGGGGFGKGVDADKDSAVRDVLRNAGVKEEKKEEKKD